MEEKKTSTVADFTRVAEERYNAERQKRVTDTSELLALPSGLTVLVYRPDLEWWVRKRGILPKGIAAKMAGATPDNNEVTPEELVEYSHFAVSLMEEMVLEPRIRLTPKEGEVSPHLVSAEDLTYLMKYAGGEIAADGQGLSTFRSGTGLTDAGPGSGSVAHTPKSDS